MKPYFETTNGQLFNGDALKVLSGMESESIQCCITSPPYWGLRDYNLPPSIWDGDKGCEHVWGSDQRPANYNYEDKINAVGNLDRGHQKSVSKTSSQFCQVCGAWRGCLGLEPTPELYVKHVVQIFREVRRVLRNDGTLWLNLGDSYHGGGSTTLNGQNTRNFEDKSTLQSRHSDGSCSRLPKQRGYQGYKPKDLCGIPWRVAFALQSDGWYLRQDIIWAKPNPMPESVTDRCTKSHEYIFLMSKSAQYFYDAEAIKEKGAGNKWGKHTNPKYGGTENAQGKMQSAVELTKQEYIDKYKTVNKRSVWTIPTKPYKEAHFATFPPALILPCVLAGTSEKGCCVECGAPWERVVEKTKSFQSGSGKSGNPIVGKQDLSASQTNSTPDIRMGPCVESKTIGWQPTCKCKTEPMPDLKPCIIIDPFAGAGTVWSVCEKYNRKSVNIELSGEYCNLIKKRITNETRQLKLFN